jgi:hypothetical protein
LADEVAAILVTSSSVCGRKLDRAAIASLDRGINHRGGQGRDEVLIEGTNCAFGGVDRMLDWRDKLDSKCVALNVPFDGFRAFVIHHV